VPTSGPVSAALANLVQQGAVIADPLQSDAARVLDRIATQLSEAPPLLGRRRSIVGAYLVGPVGRGKTMLMDLFFSSVGIGAKRRAHFDEFMDELHTAIAAFRATPRGKDADPIAAVVKPIIAGTRLLCLDEFQVNDITNAMLLGRLFERLFAAGVTLVATSNTRPDELYREGLNRQLFLPFIELLKSRVEIVSVAGGTDYRQGKFAGEAVFQFGTGPQITGAMDRLWGRLTGNAPAHPETLRSLGRDIAVPLAAMGAARFSFAALCEAPLGARDYLRLAQRYDTLMIDGVPVFGRTNPSAAKRFTLLIDTLYDRGIKLSASFAVPLDRLAAETRNQQEFQRTLSRLSEMQSAAYLRTARRAA
jgi:cell division protein ZapE